VSQSLRVRVKLPEWFVPLHGFGEWVGFLGGLLAVSGLVIVLLLVATANHVSIRVHNDTELFVRVSRCVDDAADVERGEDFDAEGVPEHDQLVCWITPSRGPKRCVAVTVPHPANETVLLSRLPIVRC
jgi:hypothetical protein